MQQRCDEHGQARKEQDDNLNELRGQVKADSSNTSNLFAEVMDRFKALEANMQRTHQDAQTKIEDMEAKVLDEIEESKEEIKEVVLTIVRKEAQRQSLKNAVEDPAKLLSRCRLEDQDQWPTKGVQTRDMVIKIRQLPKEYRLR